MYRNIKGTKDILPNDTIHWRNVENIIHNFMSVHGYGEIRTPIFEDKNLFIRSIGEHTDVVSKEIYSWTDQGGVELALRPELTAPVVRSYIQNQLGAKQPLNRLYYIDSLFRRERPQKGRQRQFHQFGIEALGSEHPEQDAEVISMAYKIFNALGIKDLIVDINSIGSPEIRSNYLNSLRNSLENFCENFCENCKNRIDQNALRLFDCKNPNCQNILTNHAPLIFDFISNDDNKHFEEILKILTKMNIPFSHNKNLVRGLDYYTRTTFEIKSSALGAQNALCGGGRYDKLVEELGGKNTPAIGFAAGLERLFIAIGSENNNYEYTLTDIYFITLGEQAISIGMNLAESIREKKGIRVTVETLRRSIKAQMREANRLGAQFVVILGENELQKNICQVKNLDNGEQTEIKIDNLLNFFTTQASE